MVLFRLNAAQPVGRVCREMDRVFNDVFEGVAQSVSGERFARCALAKVDMWEDDLTLNVEAEVPGLKMDDFEIFVHGDELTIKGERKAKDEEGRSYHCRERAVGEFNRAFRLPVEVDAENVEANLRDGVLTIKLPKVQAALPRKIAVKAS